MVRVEPSALRWSHNRGSMARQYHGCCCRTCQARTGSHPWAPCATLWRDIPGKDSGAMAATDHPLKRLVSLFIDDVAVWLLNCLVRETKDIIDAVSRDPSL